MTQFTVSRSTVKPVGIKLALRPGLGQAGGPAGGEDHPEAQRLEMGGERTEQKESDEQPPGPCQRHVRRGQQPCGSKQVRHQMGWDPRAKSPGLQPQDDQDFDHDQPQDEIQDSAGTQ